MDALMDKLIEPLITIFQPSSPWRYIAAFAALLVIVGPRLVNLWRDFLDVQMGRRRLEIEKLRLEVLKLRAEMEPSQPHELPELKRELQEIPVPPEPIPAPKQPTEKAPGRFRKWLSRYPRFSRAVMLIFQIFLAYLMIVFGVAMVWMPIFFWSEPELGLGFSVFGLFLYAGLAWLSYKGFAATRAIRKELPT